MDVNMVEMSADELRDIAKVCKDASMLIEKQLAVILNMNAQVKDLQQAMERARRVLEGA